MIGRVEQMRVGASSIQEAIIIVWMFEILGDKEAMYNRIRYIVGCKASGRGW